MSDMKENAENSPEGYRGCLRERLVKDGIRTWSKVCITKGHATYEGVLLPRSQHTADAYVTLKVDTGYNLGVHVDENTRIEETGYKKGHYQLPSVDVSFKKEFPNVTLLGTGGTVASRLDYRTGAVLPAFTLRSYSRRFPN